MGGTALRHEAVLYRDVAELVDAVAAPLGRAAAAGASVLAIVDADTEHALRARLADAAAAVRFEDPVVAFAEPAQTLVVRRRETARRLTARGPVTLLGQHQPWMSTADVALWDAAFNVALADLPVHLLCACPVAVADAAAAVAATHPALRSASGVLGNDGYRDPLEVLGAYPPAAPAALGACDGELPFTMADLPALRARAAECARRSGLAERTADLALALTEIATNSIEHGPGKGVLRWWARPGQLTCDVLDAGPFRPSLLGLAPPVGASPRGRGLWMARRLCDLVHVWFDHAGTGVRLTVTGRAPAGDAR